MIQKSRTEVNILKAKMKQNGETLRNVMGHVLSKVKMDTKKNRDTYGKVFDILQQLLPNVMLQRFC